MSDPGDLPPWPARLTGLRRWIAGPARWAWGLLCLAPLLWYALYAFSIELLAEPCLDNPSGSQASCLQAPVLLMAAGTMLLVVAAGFLIASALAGLAGRPGRAATAAAARRQQRAKDAYVAGRISDEQLEVFRTLQEAAAAPHGAVPTAQRAGRLLVVLGGVLLPGAWAWWWVTRDYISTIRIERGTPFFEALSVAGAALMVGFAVSAVVIGIRCGQWARRHQRLQDERLELADRPGLSPGMVSAPGMDLPRR